MTLCGLQPGIAKIQRLSSSIAAQSARLCTLMLWLVGIADPRVTCHPGKLEAWCECARATLQSNIAWGKAKRMIPAVTAVATCTACLPFENAPSLLHGHIAQTDALAHTPAARQAHRLCS